MTLARGWRSLLPGLAAASAILALSLLAVPNPARADLATGIAAYNQGDLQTAFREFSISARQGDAEARYRLATMYANGEGTPGNNLLAYKWLTCVAEGPVGAWLKLKAKVRRYPISLFNDETVASAYQLARQDCALIAAPAKSYTLKRVEAKTKRENWLANLLLFPGDFLVITMVGLGEFFAFGWLVKLVAGLVEFLGDVFPGIIAVVVWGIIWRICFAVFDRASGGVAGQELASQGRVRLSFRKRRNEDQIVRREMAKNAKSSASRR
jgi:hypothetical protein